MKLQCRWNGKMRFTAQAGEHRAEMDAKRPIGEDTALTPKQLLVAGLCGCTAMDVAAILRKHKQPLESLEVDADATPTEGVEPAVFTKAHLVFRMKGEVDPARAQEAVRLSQTKYCGVSAMLAKAFPISYEIELNGKVIGSGHADFK